MVSAGARAYMGGIGRGPQWGPEATPLVRGSVELCLLKLTKCSHSKQNLNKLHRFQHYSYNYQYYKWRRNTGNAQTCQSARGVYPPLKYA